MCYLLIYEKADWSRGVGRSRLGREPEAFVFALIFFVTFLYQDKKVNNNYLNTNSGEKINMPFILLQTPIIKHRIQAALHPVYYLLQTYFWRL